jgi:hypothetical protein
MQRVYVKEFMSSDYMFKYKKEFPMHPLLCKILPESEKNAQNANQLNS